MGMPELCFKIDTLDKACDAMVKYRADSIWDNAKAQLVENASQCNVLDASSNLVSHLVKQYFECQRQWSIAACNHDETEYEKWSEKGLSIRAQFSKSDWEALIAQSSGRAKFEYTRMMNEKFGK